ncbi:MAG TPA: hypothetical protein VKC61_07815 [Pyrinomonadaceae bacterium]|nr:hypothetical protein [Pyrinomonadaceae bacterium]
MPFNSESRCTQIKDRNGNYITVNYDWLGHIFTINDTLGRAITFNYDGNANLLSITQSWTLDGITQVHSWATFGWTTKAIQPSFSGVMVVGASSGYTFPVINQVGLDDGTRYTFEYNSAGQVNPIRSYRSDNIERAYTVYDYGSPADDCPRLIDTHVWAQNWTGINGVPQEVATLYGAPGDGSHTITTPDGTLYKEFYGTGYKRGLTTQTEVWSGGVKQKWTSSTWTQDNTGVNYQTNPRITETNVYDSGGNRRRTTVSYAAFTLPSGANCSLPGDTREYAGDAITILRHSHVDYRMDPVADVAYLSRHIIGLPKEQTLYEVSGGTETPMSKAGIAYNEAGSIQGNDEPVGHDNSYDSNFVQGRANLSSVKRYDVTITDNSVYTVSSVKYNTAGAVVLTSDPLNHHLTISYADSFSADGTNLDAPRSFATLAFPTTVTDADGYSSYVGYHYDLGAKTRVQGPPPDNQPQGLIQIFAYEGAGRIKRVTTTNNNAYSRYVYGPNYVESFGTINTIADESYSLRVVDGFGRVTLAAGNHPGSIGGYSARNTIYDAMGRAMKQSNPTEVTSAWLPTGDDSAGWFYTQQSYDWKARPLVTTNSDGTTKEASYSGCGCAGGEVVTLTDEGTMDGGTLKRRQSKIYSDVLGRTVKTELLNWQGGSPYATTVNDFNARDQAKSVRQYEGDEASGSYQEATITYDGYGRPRTKHVPQQDSGTFTVWDYNLDDTVQKVTDARGASATYAYNDNRGLVTGISYSAPQGITPTAGVSFEYDAVGNRTSMTDGFGSKSYSYNQLSQLMSEARTFTNVGSFPLSYDYNLAGELKKSTDSTNITLNYGHDNAGRLNSVTGSGTLYANVSNYASDFEYRAWGGLKHMTDGKGRTSSLVYSSKLQPTHFEISGNTVSQDYDYYSDGRMKIVHNMTDQNFDRSYSYDHAGRIIEAKSGGDVNGYQYAPTPYHETFGYDGFSNLTARQSDSWNGQTSDTDSATYTNSRRTEWGYDADGRNIAIGSRSITFDAAGRRTLMIADQVLANGNHFPVSQTSGYDGDGAKVYEVASGVTSYYLRSTASGGEIIEELSGSGQKNVGYVSLPGGQLLATQTGYSDQVVTWKHNTPAGTGEYTVNSYNGVMSRIEFDPLGADISLTEPLEPPPGQNEGEIGAGHFGRSYGRALERFLQSRFGIRCGWPLCFN